MPLILYQESSANEGTPDGSSKWIEEAYALSKTGQFKEVIKLTSKVDSGRTPVNKSNADDIFQANLLGGRAFSKLKNFASAEKCFKRSIEAVPLSVAPPIFKAKPYALLGDLCFDANRWADAEENYLIALKYLNMQEDGEWRDLELKTVNLFLGRLYLEKVNKPRKAISFLMEALKLEPEGNGIESANIQKGLLNAIGWAYERLDSWQKAIEYYEAAIKQVEKKSLLTRDNGELCEALRGISIVYGKQDRLEDQEQVLVRAIETQDHSSSPVYEDKFESSLLLAGCLLKQFKYDESRERAEWCLETAKENHTLESEQVRKATKELAKIDVARGDWQNTENLLKECLRDYEASGANYKNEHYERVMLLSVFYAEKRDFKRAIKFSKRAIEVIDVTDEKNLVESLYFLGNLYLFAGMPLEAEKTFTKVSQQFHDLLGRDPVFFSQVLRKLAVGEFFLGKNSAAEIHIEKSIALLEEGPYSSDKNALQWNRLFIKAALNKWDEARQIADDSVEDYCSDTVTNLIGRSPTEQQSYLSKGVLNPFNGIISLCLNSI